MNVLFCLSLRSVRQPPSVTPAIMEAQAGEEPGPSCSAPASPDPAPSPHSEAVTNELQELSLQPAPNLLPLRDRKNGECPF